MRQGARGTGKTMISAGIELVEVQDAHKVALRNGKAELRRLLGVSIPDRWPQFLEAFEPSRQRAPGKWPGYFFICPPERSLVGNGGFAGPPNADGEVEIGYEIAPQFRNRGFATTAVEGILKIAFSREQVQAVIAHTLPEENASSAVLKKCGFSLVAEMAHSGLDLVWRWRLFRPDAKAV
jgi:RimJ/RimL family protein N-acetyltransferase